MGTLIEVVVWGIPVIIIGILAFGGVPTSMTHTVL